VSTDASPTTGVTVSTVVEDLLATPDAGLDVEIVAGGTGLQRRITNSHPQKTGLALSGFDSYLRGGRVLIFGESEIRYIESLAADARIAALRRVCEHDLPCLLITGGFAAPPELALEADRAACRSCARAPRRPTRCRGSPRCSMRISRPEPRSTAC
jgi:serine kinase of HPr protein (carbohydrate metabolism regulator)